MSDLGPADTPPPAEAEARGRKKRRKVPRPVRRSLLLGAWLAATGLLAAEVFTSIRNLLD